MHDQFSRVRDARDRRPVNAQMADYLVPVNLDIPELEAHFVEESDPHVNALGVKGLGEIALVGMAPRSPTQFFTPRASACAIFPFELKTCSPRDRREGEDGPIIATDGAELLYTH